MNAFLIIANASAKYWLFCINVYFRRCMNNKSSMRTASLPIAKLQIDIPIQLCNIAANVINIIRNELKHQQPNIRVNFEQNEGSIGLYMYIVKIENSHGKI